MLVIGLGTAHAGTYADWVQAHNLPSNASDPTNAPAGDGIPNLLKFAMGLDPNTPGPDPLFQPVLVQQNGQALFGVNLSLDSTAQGVRLNLYASPDLRTWAPCGVVLQEVADLGSGMLSVQMLNRASNRGSGPLFLRLGAELTQFGQFITCPPVPVLTNGVDTNGATLTVPATGSPLDGLVLSVPAGAYTNRQTNTINYAPIIAHNFPSSVNPITPLIQIENGGALASQLMTVTVPVSLSSNEFAMGFIYDASTGELEGMPLVALSTNSITVATRHFSGWFISKIPYSALLPNVDSGFQPGVDDWEFTNRGSVWAPNGYCSGESQTAMWYYCTQKLKGAPSLYNLYDNSLYSFRTPSFGDDDELGIKLASVVQNDTDWNSVSYKFATIFGCADLDTLRCFTYSMMVSHQPQYVNIMTSFLSGSLAHSMVAYSVQSGTIYVADPNVPAATDRKIVYDDASQAFVPYYAAETADSPTIAFPKINWFAKDTMNDWIKLGQRWNELQAKTIGNDCFDVFNISLQELQNGAWVTDANVRTDTPGETPISTGADQVQISVRLIAGVCGTIGTQVFDTNGVRVDMAPGAAIALNPGTNRLGVKVLSQYPGENSFRWDEFSWLVVNHTNQGWLFTTLAGIPGVSGWRDGRTANSLFNWPTATAVDRFTNIYVADGSNNVIRLLTPDGTVTTIAGQAGVAGSADGLETNAQFSLPSGAYNCGGTLGNEWLYDVTAGMAVTVTDSATNVYVADTLNSTIRMLTRVGVGWWVSTIAGSAGDFWSQDGDGLSARFGYPSGLAADTNGNLYVADAYYGVISKLTPSAQGWMVSTLAGSAGLHGNDDGTGANARFFVPMGVAVDNSGNVYVTDTGNCTIRKITASGVVTTLAGNSVGGFLGVAGFADGMGTNALFGYPSGLAVDAAGYIYVADTFNDAIRRVTPAGMVTTLGGVGSVWDYDPRYWWEWTSVTYTYGNIDGRGTNAAFNFPNAIAVDSATNLYIVDYDNFTIRKGQR